MGQSPHRPLAREQRAYAEDVCCTVAMRQPVDRRARFWAFTPCVYEPVTFMHKLWAEYSRLSPIISFAIMKPFADEARELHAEYNSWELLEVVKWRLDVLLLTSENQMS